MPGVSVNCPLSHVVTDFSHCAWAPACIAYGLPDMAPHLAGCKESAVKGADLIGVSQSRRQSALQPDDEQAQHLRKLALHLAAQQLSEGESHQLNVSQSEPEPVACAEKEWSESAKKIGGQLIWADEEVVPSPPRCVVVQTLPQQQQEFHQQMLKKLALHLAAQEDSSWTSSKTETEKTGEVSTQLSPPFSKTLLEPVRTPSPQRSFPVHNLSQQDQDFHKQMLQKLALHLAAQEDPKEIGQNAERCNQMAVQLVQPSEAAKAAEIMDWVLLTASELSFTTCGSRLVQKAIETASAQQRSQFVEKLLPHTKELCTSPHANHILAKLVQVLPSTQLVRFAHALRGHAVSLARHQFGCRILERFIEHCSEDQIGFLLDEIIFDLEAIARHQYGNFVAQHILEHGTVERKNSCAEVLLPHVLQHSTHRTACCVVQKYLEHADLRWQAAIADVFLAGEGELSLEAIAATRYGSFVVQKLLGTMHPRIVIVKARVKAARPQLQESGFSRRKIVDFLGEEFFSE